MNTMSNQQSPNLLFEDDSLVIIDKPAGLVVNRAESVKGVTLQDWVEAQSYWMETKKRINQEMESAFFDRSGVVHRLDKDTSGVMILAKTQEAFFQLTKQFHDRLVQKRYVALVHGKVQPREGSVALPIARARTLRERFQVQGKGKYAETSWKVISYFKQIDYDDLNTRYHQGFSYLYLFPKTGRTHQIRVHMGHLSHPLVGDSRYLGKKRSKLDALWCPRHFLHAEHIQFFHPVTNNSVEFSAQLPRELQLALSFLNE